MDFEVRIISEKKLVGQSRQMSFINNTTGMLWKGFGPRIKEIQYRIDTDKISLQIYSDDFMNNPHMLFSKYAAVEVSKLEDIPLGLETYILQGGLYAVFPFKGSPLKDASMFFQKIFKEWLPKSAYKIDNARPHFEILGEKYNPLSDESEEDIYIPIR